jgi:hypothetical protein
MAKGSKRRSRKRSWTLWYVGGVVVMVILVSAFISSFAGPSPIVSPDQMEAYTSSYFNEYAMLYQNNLGLLYKNSTLFPLGITVPSTVTAVISTSHGALLLFNSTKAGSFALSSKFVDNSIEFYLYPNMPSLQQQASLPIVRIGNGSYPLDAPVNDSSALVVIDPGAVIRFSKAGNAFQLSGNGAIQVFGAIDYSNRMVLKGSNSPSAWTPLQAQFDALEQFLFDARGTINTTSATQIRVNYEVPLLLTQIRERIADGTYRANPNLFTQDFNQLKQYAPTNVLQSVETDFYSNQASPPATLSTSDIEWIISMVVGFVGWFVSPFIAKRFGWV